MQVRRFAHWTNRTVGYACRQIADQIHSGFDYGKLEPVIQISIMDHSLFPDHKKFFNEYIPRDKEGYPYTDKLKFLVMDLTQIEEASQEQKDQGLVEWAKAFRANSWEEVNDIDNSGVKEAARTMQLIMSNPTEREMIRMRQDVENDWRTIVNSEREQAQIDLMVELVRDGILSEAEAAKRLGMSEEEFVRSSRIMI